jgi:adenylyltransferase/sulfurtransferase
MAWTNLSPAEARAALAAGREVRVLDVRTPLEHEHHRLAGATLIPLHELAERAGELDPGAQWFVYCEHGRRSIVACEILTGLGFGRLLHLAGGITDWMAAGYPVDGAGAPANAPAPRPRWKGC